MRRTRMVMAAVAAFVMLIVSANLALADDLVVDGDALTSGSTSNGANTSVRDARCDSNFVGSGSAVITYSGGTGRGVKHLAAGSSVVVTSTPTAAAAEAGISTGGGGSVTVPLAWTDGASFTVPISATVPTSVLDGSYKIETQAVGVDQNGDPLILSDDYQVIVDCGREPVVTATDTTPPTITYTFNGTAGSNGWYKSGGTLDWTVSDLDSTITSTTGCNDVAISADTDSDGDDYTCSATSAGGTAGPVTATIKIDSLAPTAAPSLSAANYNDWYNAPVTVTWNWSDGGSSGLASCASTSTYSAPDSATASMSASCSDMAGNSSGSVSSGTFKYDATAPTTTVTGVTADTSYALGSFTLGCLSSDNLSGIETQASSSTTGANANGVGDLTTTCSGAKDNAGNTASNASVTYTTTYMPSDSSLWSGILQPINSDNTSMFSRGKTVPVKWKMSGDEPNGFVVTGWKVESKVVSCASNFDGPDATLEVGSTSSAGLRYDGNADQYVYNADFRNTSIGTCLRVRGVFDNGETTKWSGAFKITK